MPQYVEVAVNVPQVTGVFHYHLPPELEDQVVPGCLAVVPFGRQTVYGVVLRFVDQPSVAETKPLLELVESASALTPLQLALAAHLAESTLASLADCIGLMLPPGLMQRADTLYELPPGAPDPGALSNIQSRLYTLLQQRGPLRGGQIDRALPRINWRSAARQLVQRGLLASRSILPPPTVQAKFIRTVQLARPPHVIEQAIAEFESGATSAARRPAAERRIAILRHLLVEPGPVDVAWVYAASGGNTTDLRYLADRDLIVLGESELWRDPLEGLDFTPTTAPPLTRDQQAVWETVRDQIQVAASGKPTRPMLLHGVTGSGKTEIYLHAVEETLKLGRQALVLVPEISLTPQTLRRFAGRFPGQVGLIHSRLSPGERYDTWRRARAGGIGVIVGPRSALFSPLPDLGLVVVDESHDDSYYQDEIRPHYHAREAAVAAARLAGGVCLFGSATPDVTSTYRAAQGWWRYLHLPARILAHQQAVSAQAERLGLPSRFHHLEALAETKDLPPVQVVDMREELKAGNRSMFSRDLQAALAETLERGEQAILFLNRRGASTYVFCRDCGSSVRCPRCSIPLTSHAGRAAGRSTASTPEPGEFERLDVPRLNDLVCHHCGYRRLQPATCPVCGSRRIRHLGVGTERVEAELQGLFPQARSLRWDYETTRQKGAHEVILGHFAAHRADVLVGTQMLAKGLDLPLVTLVGVVLADVGLNLPDYRAAERTFQVLTQVAGRAGRSLLGGKVVLQTFQPENYAIQAASGHDYRQFYDRELAYRRQLGYPPFTQLVRLELRHREAEQVEAAAQELAGKIREWLKAEDRRATSIIGPAPCFFARLNGMYRWQIILRGPDPASLLRNRIPSADLKVEVNPPNLL